MSKRFFGDIGPVRFEGVKSDNPYAYGHYDPARVALGKTMAEQLCPAVCYWRNFASRILHDLAPVVRYPRWEPDALMS
jgi:xylose isomerase